MDRIPKTENCETGNLEPDLDTCLLANVRRIDSRMEIGQMDDLMFGGCRENLRQGGWAQKSVATGARPVFGGKGGKLLEKLQPKPLDRVHRIRPGLASIAALDDPLCRVGGWKERIRLAPE